MLKVRSAALISYISAFCLFSIVPAFYTWGSIFIPLFVFLLSFMLIMNLQVIGKGNSTVAFFIVFFLLHLYMVLRTDSNINGIIVTLSISLYFLVKKSFVVDVFDKFVKVYAIFIAISLTVYLFVLLGFNLPYTIIPPLNTLKTEVYRLYPFLVTTLMPNGSVFPRFYGLFDEPGVVGTISSIILYAEGFNLRKKQNIIVLLSGLLSLSFFFYVICIVYMSINVKWKLRIFLFAFVLSMFFVFQNNEFAQERLIARFVVEDGELLGDNRTQKAFDDYFDSFRFTTDYYIGKGAGFGSYLNEGGCSYKQVIVDHGVIFFIIYILSFLLLVRMSIKKKKQFLLFLLLFIGVMYQRPFIGLHTLTFLMMSAGYIMFKEENHLRLWKDINR